jgi:uroporphyrinogen-III synthase
MKAETEIKKEDRRFLKRKRIMESAAQLFSKMNYHEVMVDEVAKLASIAKGTVYNYFESKEELYFSIMRQRMEKLIASLKENNAAEMSSVDSLHSFVIHLYMFMMKYQDFFLIYQKESLNGEHQLCSELNKLESDFRNMLSEIITTGKEEKFFRNIDEDFAVDLILGSIFGAVSRGIEKKLTGDKLVEEREKIFDFIFQALFSGMEKKNILPLKGKTIVITRTVEQSKESSGIFNQLGAQVIIFPTLDIVPPDSWQQFDKIAAKKDNIDFIIFTSAYAVKMFVSRCSELNVEMNFKKIKVVAVGNKTAVVCEKNNIPVEIIPSKFSGEGVVNALAHYDLDGKVIFIPRSAIGREELPNELEKLGAIIKAAPVYNVAIPSEDKIKKYIDRLNESKPDLFIFTSPSTFKNFLEILRIKNPLDYFKNLDIAAIGPTTKSELKNHNINVTIMPDEYTIEGLAKAIIDHYNVS